MQQQQQEQGNRMEDVDGWVWKWTRAASNRSIDVKHPVAVPKAERSWKFVLLQSVGIKKTVSIRNAWVRVSWTIIGDKKKVKTLHGSLFPRRLLARSHRKNAVVLFAVQIYWRFYGLEVWNNETGFSRHRRPHFRTLCRNYLNRSIFFFLPLPTLFCRLNLTGDCTLSVKIHSTCPNKHSGTVGWMYECTHSREESISPLPNL